jgi:hypothetical protein
LFFRLAGNYPRADYKSAFGTPNCQSTTSMGPSDYFHRAHQGDHS